MPIEPTRRRFISGPGHRDPRNVPIGDRDSGLVIAQGHESQAAAIEELCRLANVGAEVERRGVEASAR